MFTSKFWKITKSWVLMILQVGGIAFFLQWSFNNIGNWGWMGLIFLILALAAIRLIQKREDFMAAMRNIETMIWGRPLDKVYGKPPKLKVIKKNDGKN